MPGTRWYTASMHQKQPPPRVMNSCFDADLDFSLQGHGGDKEKQKGKDADFMNVGAG